MRGDDVSAAAKHAATSLVEGSNWLAELAARIKQEHETVSAALTDSLRHAIEAGELLQEAKKQVPHGGWRPWLAQHCTISERTAQLYMRCAKNRTVIENQIRNGVADLSLNEAAAMLMLSSDVRKLLSLAKTMEGLEGEELVNFSIENEIAMISGNIFGAPEPTEQERIEWDLFALFLARSSGYTMEGSLAHVDWVQSRGTCLAEWMKPNPTRDKWMPLPKAVFDAWNDFLEANRHRTPENISAEIKALIAEDAARPKGGRQSRKRSAEDVS
jgi:hypothetical protein